VGKKQSSPLLAPLGKNPSDAHGHGHLCVEKKLMSCRCH